MEPPDSLSEVPFAARSRLAGGRGLRAIPRRACYRAPSHWTFILRQPIVVPAPAALLRRFALAALWFAPQVAAAQDCFAPVHSADVEAALVKADAAWSADDDAGLRAAVQEVDAFVLPCLVEPITPEVAAHLHRVQGLVAFLDRQREVAFAAMRASRVLQPAFVYDDALLPPGHELRIAHEASPTAPAEGGSRLPVPKAATLWFDGTQTRVRPDDRATVAQVQARSGSVTTAWLAPGAPMIAYAPVPKVRTALAVTAGVTAALAGGLLGGSYATSAQYYDTDPSDSSRLDHLRSSTSGLAGGSIASGLSALGLAIGAIAVGPR